LSVKYYKYERKRDLYRVCIDIIENFVYKSDKFKFCGIRK